MRRIWFRLAKFALVAGTIVAGGAAPAVAVPGVMAHCHDADIPMGERIMTWLHYSDTMGMGTEREGPLGSSRNGEHAKHTQVLYKLSNWCVVEIEC